MRRFVALVIALTAGGCAGMSGSAPRDAATVEAIAAEVATLPASGQKDRLEALVAQLRNAPARSTTQTSLTPAEIDGLMDFAESSGVVSLELGFATDGKDWSGDGVDDGIDVHLVPRDSTGDAVKCPGSLEVTLAEQRSFLSMTSDIDKWVVSTDTLRRSWNASVFPSYVVQLPWHRAPEGIDQARLSVTFTPLFGRPLTVRKAVRLKLK